MVHGNKDYQPNRVENKHLKRFQIFFRSNEILQIKKESLAKCGQNLKKFSLITFNVINYFIQL